MSPSVALDGQPGSSVAPVDPAGEARRGFSVQVRKVFAPRRSSAFTLDVDIVLPPGVTAVLGESGAGKSTLLHCLAGLARPDDGVVTLGDRPLFDADRGIDVPVALRRVGLVFQDLALFPHLDVRRNAEYGLRRVSRTERTRRVDAMLDLFQIAHLAKRKVGTLSGGERQRVACVRSLVTSPDALLLDEAFASLDTATKQSIMEALVEWNARHRVPIVLVTHSVTEARTLAEGVILLNRGQVAGIGTVDEMLGVATVRPDGATRLRLPGVVLSICEQTRTAVCQVHGQRVTVPISDRRIVPGSQIVVDLDAAGVSLAVGRSRSERPPARSSAAPPDVLD